MPRPVIALLSLLALAGCKGDERPDGSQARDAAADAAAAPVEVVEAVVGPIADGIEATGTVEATVRAMLRSRAAGVLRSVEVEEGAAVDKGLRMARIDRPEMASIVAQARASSTKARNDQKTAERLAEKGLVPSEQVDEARFAARQARLEVDRLKDEQALGTVRAPIDGVVVARHVQAGEAVTLGAPLFDIADLSALELNLHIPERHLSRLSPGMRVEVEADGLGDDRVAGRVARIAPVVDPRSGTVKVTVELGDGDGGRLRPGMYVRARVVLDTRPSAVLVPKRAVIHEDDRSFAYLVADAVARRVPLELGYSDRERVEVREGVSAGDLLIVFGHRGLDDGARVRVVEPPKATPPAADEGRPTR